MHLFRQILLTMLLTLFLLGLVAHSLPVTLCGCARLADNNDAASNPDLCLVCQLQAGIHLSSYSANHHQEIVFTIDDWYVLNPLIHASRVVHPPIA